jgi:dTDP-4-amino-4,6-dideoxygalactose transaminase
MVTVNDEAAAERIPKLVNHDRTQKYDHGIMGYHYRLDALQAAVLTVRLRHLPAWTEARRRVARAYTAKLQGAPVVAPRERFGHVYHLYVIQCDNRDRVAEELKKAGIATGVHYPKPLHLQPCFRDLPSAGAGKLQVTERLAGRDPCRNHKQDDQAMQIRNRIS